MKRVESKRKRRNEVITNVANMPLLPPPPPAHGDARTVTLRIGGSRYEMTFHSEIREVRKGPAIIIQLPGKND